MAGSFNRRAGVGAEQDLHRGDTSRCGTAGSSARGESLRLSPLAPSPAVEGERDPVRGHRLAAEVNGERGPGQVGGLGGGRDAVPEAEAKAYAGHLSHRLSPRPHGHAVAGDLARPEGQADEASRRVVGIELTESCRSDELSLAEPPGPAETAAVGV